jgi:beta-barrel assembly-enhancing protease
MRWLAAILLSSMALVGCQNPINDPIDSVVQRITNPQKEIAKGRQQYPYALAQSGGDLMSFPTSTTYLNQLITTLAETGNSPFPWEIRLINDASINAWALPGGKMGVNYGLILAVDTEAELVSVLGHEMAHSLELHGTGRETFGTIVGIAAQLIEIGVTEPGTQSSARELIGLGQNMLMGQYSQANELEADRVGVDLMARAGFRPQGAVGMQEKLAELGGGGNSIAQKLLGTHPISRERLAAIRAVVAQYPDSGREDSPEFTKVKAELTNRKGALDQVGQARKLGGEGQFQQALDTLAGALETLPNEHSLWRLQAELLVAAKKPTEAVTAALKVRELNPSDPISELLLGYCYEAAGDLANANAARDRAKRLAR